MSSIAKENAVRELAAFFDGGCPLCRREIAFYRRLRGADKIAWVDVSRSDLEEVTPRLSRCAAMSRFHVLLPDGRLVSGGPAFAAVWRQLPAFRPLGLIFENRPMAWLLDRAYGGFLKLRPALQRLAANREKAGDAPFPQWLTAELRSDHAGETGAVWIYKGILAISRDRQARVFAERHRATERRHLEAIEQVLPPPHRSRLLPAWRLAGWLTGALPAFFGARAIYVTIAAVETFVDQHYKAQIEALSALPRYGDLRRLLEDCRQDEIDHRDEAKELSGDRNGPFAKLWTRLVGAGSRSAVSLARRL